MKLKIIITILVSMAFSFSVNADEIYQENAAAVCQNLKQKNYSKKCMGAIKGAKFNDSALAYCAKQGNWNKVKGCLSLIQDVNYDINALAICTAGKYFNNELKGCIKDIANKSYVSKIELDMCTQEKYYSRQIKCLKTASSKAYQAPVVAEGKNSEQALVALQAQVKEAYALLRGNKTSDATILLHDLVQGFDQK